MILAYGMIGVIVVAVLITAAVLFARAREDRNFRRSNDYKGVRRIFGFRRRH